MLCYVTFLYHIMSYVILPFYGLSTRSDARTSSASWSRDGAYLQKAATTVMCIYIYIYIHVYNLSIYLSNISIYLCIYLFIYLFINLSIHLYLSLYIYIYTNIHMHTTSASSAPPAGKRPLDQARERGGRRNEDGRGPRCYTRVYVINYFTTWNQLTYYTPLSLYISISISLSLSIYIYLYN